MANVKVLLKESVRNLGRVGDIVDVSPGFARNYLLPNSIAVEPTPTNIKQVEVRKQEVLKQERDLRLKQEGLIKTLTGVEVTLERRANDQGHLFGSVGATDIAKALQAAGHHVEAADINLHTKLDKIEKYTVEVKFAEDLKTDIKVWVAPDPESKASIDAAAKAKAVAAAPVAQ